MLRAAALLAFTTPLLAADPTVPTRTRVEVVTVTQKNVPSKPPGKIVENIVSSEIKVRIADRKIVPAATAIVVCDMWDNHWCVEAAKRCDSLAKKTAPVLDASRKAGVTIIHCPSDCMDAYAEHPARKRTLELPVATPPEPKKLPDPPLPIDDKDGGCDDAMPVKAFKAWRGQNAALPIDGDKDFITDKGTEVWNILAAKKIDTVIVLGVHTNMCVLNRSFGIKALRRWCVDCLLVRDLTDTMYNPAQAPKVGHDRGTELVVEFIERHWCPTVESKDLLKAFGK